jgi:predicted  nucleic acid-binding Zn-ribbon protein
VSEPHPVDEGVARLESVLAGTRMNAERALRELHGAMQRDLRRAERRAERAERRVEALRGKLRKARRRAERAERRLASACQAARPGAVSGVASGAAGTARKALGRVKRKVRLLRQG